MMQFKYPFKLIIKGFVDGGMSSWVFWGSAELEGVKRPVILGHRVLWPIKRSYLKICIKSNTHDMSAVSVTFPTPMCIISICNRPIS